MAGLVAHHEVDQVLEQLFARQLMEVRESRHREALDEDLHAEVFEIPARVLDDRVEQPLEIRVDGPFPFDLLRQVAGEDLDVARFVHRLARGVELRIRRPIV